MSRDRPADTNTFQTHLRIGIYSNNKLLGEIFDKKQKETNDRLREIMLEIYTFAEQQAKQLKKLNA